MGHQLEQSVLSSISGMNKNKTTLQINALIFYNHGGDASHCKRALKPHAKGTQRLGTTREATAHVTGHCLGGYREPAAFPRAFAAFRTASTKRRPRGAMSSTGRPSAPSFSEAGAREEAPLTCPPTGRGPKVAVRPVIRAQGKGAMGGTYATNYPYRMMVDRASPT